MDVFDVCLLFLSSTIYIDTYLTLNPTYPYPNNLSRQSKSVDLSKEPHPNKERGDHQGKKQNRMGSVSEGSEEQKEEEK